MSEPSTIAAAGSDAPELPFRILPRVNDSNRHFWTGGEHGELRFLRCRDCGYYIHPPLPMCPKCHSKRVEPEAVSGRATVASYTINHQMWMPGPELPYVVAIVEIEEQPSVRLTTNLVGIAPDDVAVGLPVQVTFEHRPDPYGDVWIPLFEPRSTR
ncbi:MAG: Zn-ribbon domain-containing OB-fold protein [Acidimicrobiia bacterium]